MYRVKNWSTVMKYQGNYFTGNLACQNLGDCSLCLIPTIVKDETNKEKINTKENFISRLLKKTNIKKS